MEARSGWQHVPACRAGVWGGTRVHESLSRWACACPPACTQRGPADSSTAGWRPHLTQGQADPGHVAARQADAQRRELHLTAALGVCDHLRTARASQVAALPAPALIHRQRSTNVSGSLYGPRAAQGRRPPCCTRWAYAAHLQRKAEARGAQRAAKVVLFALQAAPVEQPRVRRCTNTAVRESSLPVDFNETRFTVQDTELAKKNTENSPNRLLDSSVSAATSRAKRLEPTRASCSKPVWGRAKPLLELAPVGCFRLCACKELDEDATCLNQVAGVVQGVRQVNVEECWHDKPAHAYPVTSVRA